MIIYKDELNDVTALMLRDFFEGWKQFPSPEKLLKILNNSSYKFLALDSNENKVVGFINALSDGVLSAYIPLLEVLPGYRNKGIGSELVKKILCKLDRYYMIDIICDLELEKFYSKFGFNKSSSMIIRNYANQSGRT